MDVTVVASRTATVFDSDRAPADGLGLRHLATATAEADLAAPAVVLPDFHHKSNMEMPSSIAVATRETIRPTLSSASLNCGMALIAFDMAPPSRVAIERFFRSIRERYPYPPGYRVELSRRDVVRCATDGAAFAAERYSIEDPNLDRVEESGRIDLQPYGGPARVKRELPWLVGQLARLRFGTVGPGNHFIELQRVDEILDSRAAEMLGLRRGQFTLQYHCGGGMLAGEIGLLFGRRKHFPRPQRAVMALQKPLFHLASARSLDQFRERIRLYFADGCPPVPRHGAEGERLMLANAAAMNYGFAFRMATYAALRGLARQSFGVRRSRLIVDSPHNSIYEEEVDGQLAIVHRHNACRAYPPSRMHGHAVFSTTGQPTLLPGTNRTSSYVCVGAEGAARSLYSACHGSGMLIEQFEQAGLSGPDRQGRRTLRFRYSDASAEEVPQLDDAGVDEALSILTANELVAPVARLRPIAVLT